MRSAVEVLRDTFKADNREITDAFGADVFDILSSEGENEAPVTGWMGRECALFETYRAKRGQNKPIGGILRSIIKPKQARLDLLAEVVRVKTEYLDACDKYGIGSDAAKAVKKELKAAKEPLPCVAFQGVFDGKGKADEHFVSANGVYGLDYDFRRESDAAAFKPRVFAAPFVGAAWLSGSLRGVHALALGPVTTTAAEYRDAWAEIEGSLFTLTGEHADSARKNRNGLLSPSYDKHLLWRRAPTAFELKSASSSSDAGSSSNSSDAGSSNAGSSNAGASVLERQLERIPNPDLHYDDWRRVVFVARDEFGQAGRAAAERWSARSSKHTQSGFDDLWNSTPRTAGETVGWGTLVQMAGGFNAKGGRPRSETPKAEALRKRADRASEELNERLLEIAPVEVRDAERVVAYCADHLLLVKSKEGEEAMIANASGFWETLEHRRTDRSTGALARIVTKARRRAIAAGREQRLDADALNHIEAYWSEGNTAKEKGDLARQVAQRIAGREVPVSRTHEEQMDDRTRAPVIPLEDADGAWDMKRKCVISPIEVASYRMRERGWNVPTPVDESTSYASETVDAELDGRYKILFERTAALFIKPAKVVDVFICQKSSFGKTTFYDLLREAFPGMIIVTDARSAYNKTSMRFTPVASATAQAALVVVDGCGHLEHDLPSAALDAHTDTLVTVEMKGENQKTMRRSANIVLVGHSWPKIDVDAQGADTRLRWALKVDDDAPILEQERRDILMSPEGIARFRWRFVETIGRLINDPKGPLAATETDESRKWVELMIRERGCPMIAALKETYQLERGGFVLSSELEEVVKGCSLDGKVPTGKVIGAIVRKAFGASAILTRKQGGDVAKRGRGWSGLVRKSGIF